jgi:hypothetical protein
MLVPLSWRLVLWSPLSWRPTCSGPCLFPHAPAVVSVRPWFLTMWQSTLAWWVRFTVGSQSTPVWSLSGGHEGLSGGHKGLSGVWGGRPAPHTTLVTWRLAVWGGYPRKCAGAHLTLHIYHGWSVNARLILIERARRSIGRAGGPPHRQPWFLGWLGTCQQIPISTRRMQPWKKRHFAQWGMLKFTYKGCFLTLKKAYGKFLYWLSSTCSNDPSTYRSFFPSKRPKSQFLVEFQSFLS